MSRTFSKLPARTAMLVTLVAALLLLLLGGLSLQQTGSFGSSGAANVSAGHAAIDASHLSTFAEAPDVQDVSPLGFEYLNALALGLFLVSLGLLLRAGLVGTLGEQRLLNLMRLPALPTLFPSRAPLSALEVFRL